MLVGFYMRSFVFVLIFLTRAMLFVFPFGKHDSGTQAKYPGSKGLLIDPIYFDPAKMEKFV